MTNILDTIIAHKQTEVATLNAAALRYAAEHSPAPRDFLAAISSGTGVKLIAELKRASPSKGILAPHLDLFQVADIYMDNGATAISVLTDEKFFLGRLETLYALRSSHPVRVPLLRKDFTIAEVQLYEARANGADAILLIAAALLDNGLFAALHATARALGLTALVEVHNEAELERALKIPNLKLIGINNRDLGTFEVSLETTERLRPLVPPGIAIVAESGIFKAQDVARLEKVGVDAILVGEALITAPDIAAKVRELVNIV
jgi:indole-3-glycerol phosphate synthase